MILRDNTVVKSFLFCFSVKKIQKFIKNIIIKIDLLALSNNTAKRSLKNYRNAV